MATVLNVSQSWSPNTAGTNVRTRVASKTFTVLFDGPDDDLEWHAKQAAGVPQVQVDTHPRDSFLVATGVSTKMLSPILVEVTVDYGTPAVAGFNTVIGSDGESQLDLRPSVSWETLDSIEESDQDVNGDVVRNTNGDPILIEREIRDPLLKVTLYRETINIATIMQYVAQGGSTNSDAFLGTLPGQACIRRIRPEKLYYGPYEYWRVDYEVAFRQGLSGQEAKAWWIRHANKGFRVKVGTGSTKYRAQVDPANDGVATSSASPDWSPTPEPVFLNEDGTRVSDGGTVFWLTTQRYPSLPFAGLGVTI